MALAIMDGGSEEEATTMARDGQRVQQAAQADLSDLVEQVHAGETPTLNESEGQLRAVVFPADDVAQHSTPTEPTPAETVRAFYERMAERPDVRDLLSRLAKK